LAEHEREEHERQERARAAIEAEEQRRKLEALALASNHLYKIEPQDNSLWWDQGNGQWIRIGLRVRAVAWENHDVVCIMLEN